MSSEVEYCNDERKKERKKKKERMYGSVIHQFLLLTIFKALVRVVGISKG